MHCGSLLFAVLLCSTQTLAQTIDWGFELPPTKSGVQVVTGTSGEGYSVSEFGDLVRFDVVTGTQTWIVQINSLFNVVDMAWHPDGHVVILGGGLRVVAVDTSGQVVWSIQWTDPMGPGIEAVDLEIEPSGNIYAAATSNGLYGRQALLKISAAGSLQWARTHDFVMLERERCTSIAVNAQGNILQTGWFGNTAERDWSLLCYDSLGTLLWSDTYDHFPNSFDWDTRACADTLGAWYVAGISPEVNQAWFEVTLRKYDTSGTVLWTRHLHNSTENFIHDVQLDPDGNVVVLAETNEYTGQGYALFKVSPSNVLLWSASSTQGILTEAKAMAIAADGTIFVAGNKQWVNPERDAMVESWSQTGTKNWSHLFPTQSSIDEQSARAIHLDSFGGILLTGSNGVGTDMFLTYRLCITPTGICFELPESSPTVEAKDAVLADMDQNGYPDLVVTDAVDPLLAIHLNYGGGFGPADTVALPFAVLEPLAGDVDQDGDMDLVVHSAAGNALLVIRNTGGTFSPDPPINTSPQIRAMAMNDIDGINGPDLAMIKYNNPQITFLLNNGNGSFITSTLTAPVLSLLDVVLEDATDDGIVDLMVGPDGVQSVFVFPGSGNGTFGLAMAIPSGNMNNAFVGVGDVDNDGIGDIVSAAVSYTASIIPGLGSGQYDTAIVIPTGLSGAKDMVPAPFGGTLETAFAIRTLNGAWGFVHAECIDTYQIFTLYTAALNAGFAFGSVNWDTSVDVIGITQAGEILVVPNCDTTGVIPTAVHSLLSSSDLEELRLDPNPTNTFIRVSWPDPMGPMHIRVLDLAGSLVREFPATYKGTTLDLSGMDSGVYVIEATNGSKRTVGRCVIAPH